MNRTRMIQTLFAVLAGATLAASGCENHGGSGSGPCKPLEAPCEGGELLTKNAYSECCNGFWHLVEDDTYACPPAGAVTTFRVADDPTSQPCTGTTAGTGGTGGDGGSTLIPGCMAECPQVDGCTRVSVTPGACSNATCTAPDPWCGYECGDGGFTVATGSCIPPK
jgi:hypothetical protein